MTDSMTSTATVTAQSFPNDILQNLTYRPGADAERTAAQAVLAAHSLSVFIRPDRPRGPQEDFL